MNDRPTHPPLRKPAQLLQLFDFRKADGAGIRRKSKGPITEKANGKIQFFALGSPAVLLRGANNARQTANYDPTVEADQRLALKVLFLE